MLLWIVLAALYLAALFVLGLTTLRKGTRFSSGWGSSSRSCGSWAH
jgi:hypothetical protein